MATNPDDDPVEREWRQKIADAERPDGHPHTAVTPIARSRSASCPSLERFIEHLGETLEIHLLFSIVRPPVVVDVTSPIAALRALFVDERVVALAIHNAARAGLAA